MVVEWAKGWVLINVLKFLYWAAGSQLQGKKSGLIIDAEWEGEVLHAM